MNIKSILLASTVILTGAFGAQAADAIQYEEPVPVVAAPVFSWTGGYLGGQIGYGWGKSRFSNEFTAINVKPDGFLGGLYAGYNFDLGNSFVLGIDGDVTYNNLKDSYSETDLGVTDSLESKLRWSGAVRARAGVAMDRFLPYIAGGVAFGSVKNTLSSTDGIDEVSVSQSKTLTGWTAGAGVDYAATDNVIVRLEYRYTDYGHKDFDFGVPDAGVRDKFKTNEVRLGVAYKF
ncbi:porin family protein [Brucella pseudogrignonensis]|jgi:outer membrane immunogenic protein|uniref:outer membrane protein n=1 Tax=Brucella pseudogrignonensis TaxID=419475 RepID=UPI000CFB92C0|nr:outer membrane protein [Brucella pseudogrignonensis]MQP40596.1 outer membrane beta-barrel protein [Ochrobactrum sp. MYb237]KAB2685818.1 porin family protein [Brucella pseudogrignonensis]MCD4511822.1 porin family protein [Brucella pseudogrignonensis]PQZ38984.1 autotransporter outer membrane beta-barrel domain-containing protein [Brucella pseudogrignonensis]PRA40833.1 autotransporter outer membrane beta-barrel domain-containing protein [Brucella pseudogrignonensis]